jgi:hypothetical protein
VSDATESHIFKVIQIGKMVSFSQPETQLDGASTLHVLWQSGAATFVYVVINPDGGLVKQEVYDYITARPRLNVNPDGSVVVVGGSRRVNVIESSQEMPLVKPPSPAPVPAKP